MRYLFAIAFLFLFAPPSAHALWLDSNWDYRVAVNIAPSKVGTTSAVTNFPVYIDLTGFPTSFWTNVQSDGDDIRVAESDEITETPFELVAISTASSTGELHFLADSLSTTSTSTFYIYYGNPDASGYGNTATYGRNNVWAPKYRMVHHATSSAQATDSTSNGLNGTPTNMDSTNVVAGQVGRTAYDFNGTDEYVTRGTDDASLDFGSNPFSFSTWVRADTWVNQSGLWSKKFGDAGGGYEFFRDGGPPLRDLMRLSTPSIEDHGLGNIVATTSAWQLIHVVCSPSTGCDIWNNGISQTLAVDGGGYTSIANASQSFMYGRAEVRLYFDGRMDEFRIASTTLDHAHIVTEHNNQSSTSTFYMLGSETTNEATTTPSTLLHGSGMISGGTIMR